MGELSGGVWPETRIVMVKKNAQHRMLDLLLTFHCIELTSAFSASEGDLKQSDFMTADGLLAIIARLSRKLLSCHGPIALEFIVS